MLLSFKAKCLLMNNIQSALAYSDGLDSVEIKNRRILCCTWNIKTHCAVLETLKTLTLKMSPSIPTKIFNFNFYCFKFCFFFTNAWGQKCIWSNILNVCFGLALTLNMERELTSNQFVTFCLEGNYRKKGTFCPPLC